MDEREPLPEMKRYEPAPYWGCPRCGGNKWGAVNPTNQIGQMVYRCHGATMVGNPLSSGPGCGALFTMPQEASDEYRQGLIDAGFTLTDDEDDASGE